MSKKIRGFMKTVYVLGAGASKEYGLPIGDELKENISQLLRIPVNNFGEISGGNQLIKSCFMSKWFGDLDYHMRTTRVAELANISNRISTNLPLAISIDNYVDNHRENQNIEKISKLAISYCILQAERKSKMVNYKEKHRPLVDLNALSNTWIVKLFRTITENRSFQELESVFRNITFVVFNYDRCLEYFLFNALLSYYSDSGATKETVRELINSITIFHPYGKIGVLPELLENPSDGMQFGGEVDEKKLVEIASQINTFTQGTAESNNSVAGIRKALSETQRQVYLGFAFHELNMELLRPKSATIHDQVKIYATTLGMGESDAQIVKSKISNLVMGGITNAQTNRVIKDNYKDVTCSSLFDSFRLSLSYT